MEKSETTVLGRLIHKEVINFAEDGKMLDSDNEIIEIFNNYLCNIANVISSKNLSSVLKEPSMVSEDPVKGAITNLKNHPSVKFVR